MQPLWRWANVDHAHLEGVGFVSLEATEFDHCRRRLKYTVGTYRIERIVQRNRVGLGLLSTSQQTLLYLDNVFRF